MKNYLIESLTSILGEEDRGIMFNLTTEEERKVRELIDIDLYNTVDELRILRNYLVISFMDYPLYLKSPSRQPFSYS